jgi:hypothetical protein
MSLKRHGAAAGIERNASSQTCGEAFLFAILPGALN